jgi:hypothetical protein
MFSTDVDIPYSPPSKTAVKSFTAVVCIAIGSLKCLVKKTFVKLAHPCAPCISGMHPLIPKKANVAPIGCESLKGLIESGFGAISPMAHPLMQF